VEPREPTRWIELRVEVPAESAEAVGAILRDAGCLGTAELGRDPATVVGHLPASDRVQGAIERIEDRLAELPACGLSAPLGFSAAFAEDTDWATEWRKHFRPLEVGRRIVIKPTWEQYEGDSDRVVVELDPGMAFGTGGHPTTRLCLAALEDWVRPGCVVADIGTGSGILALAAAKLGASRVHATDIDLLPRRIARENVERGGLHERVLVHEMEEFDRVARGCDVVVANILASTVMELAPSVRGRLKPGGVFIASGIVEERLPEVLKVLADAGFRVEEVREEEIWRAVVAVAE